MTTFLPRSLVVPLEGSEIGVIGAIIAGEIVPSYRAIVVTGLACVVFTIVAFGKWARTEL